MGRPQSWAGHSLPAPASLTAATIILTTAELIIDIVNAILRVFFQLGIGR